MQQWREVGPGKYESESASAEFRADPNRLLVSFTDPIEPAEAVGLIRAASLDLNLECMTKVTLKERNDLLGNLDQVRLPNEVVSDYDYDSLN